MTIFALVDGTRICDVSAETFPVAPELTWHQVSDDTTTRDTFVDGAVVKEPTPLLDDVKRVALRNADDRAESVRLRYITPGAGMAMTYAEKFAQAQAVAAMGQSAANAMSQEDREEQFPTLSASVGLEAPTLFDCAQLVLTKFAQFAALSLEIERARLTCKAQIKAARDVEGVQAAAEAATWPTRA